MCSSPIRQWLFSSTDYKLQSHTWYPAQWDSTTGFLQSLRSGDLTDSWGFIHSFQRPGFNTTKSQCPASRRLQQPRAAVGFAVSSSPVLSAQVTQDSGWPFLPPKLLGREHQVMALPQLLWFVASSISVICPLQPLLWQEASPEFAITGNFLWGSTQ